MSDGYTIKNPASTYFLTLQVIGWVDVFTRRIYRDSILESLTYCRQQKGPAIYGYVVMSNHVHLMVRAQHENLPDVIRDLKKFTANRILKEIATSEIERRKDWMLKRFEFAAQRHVRNSVRQFWTHENHAVEILSKKFTDQKLNYIHENPVQAGWVEEPQEYLYSSARNYSGRKGLIDIDLI